MKPLRLIPSFCAVLLAVAVSCPLTSAAQNGTWSFAVSGDSRNCGDIVVPAIADGVHKDGAKFYWDLGDFRANYDYDQDMLAAYTTHGKHLSVEVYQREAWPDFIAHQVDAFGSTPVFLTIGNHELLAPRTRADYLLQFADWLDTPMLREQRLKDDPTDHKLHIYYHWIEGGVDFVAMDNASSDQFDSAQMKWFERTLKHDETDPAIRTVVLGMHDALPDSLSAGHSMDESAQMERSGRKVYQDLLDFRDKTKKYVYVLASHSHFLMENVYNDACHTTPDTVLPGWIVGTAGATRYRLPANTTGAKLARTDVYGYLLGTVQPGGKINFAFKELKPADIPSSVVDEYGSKQVQACFEDNKSSYVPEGPTCGNLVNAK